MWLYFLEEKKWTAYQCESKGRLQHAQLRKTGRREFLEKKNWTYYSIQHLFSQVQEAQRHHVNLQLFQELSLLTSPLYRLLSSFFNLNVPYVYGTNIWWFNPLFFPLLVMKKAVYLQRIIGFCNILKSYSPERFKMFEWNWIVSSVMYCYMISLRQKGEDEAWWHQIIP